MYFLLRKTGFTSDVDEYVVDGRIALVFSTKIFFCVKGGDTIQKIKVSTFLNTKSSPNYQIFLVSFAPQIFAKVTVFIVPEYSTKFFVKRDNL